MRAAGRSCVRNEKFVFTQQIENFSWWLRRGTYVSPKYPCSGCSWSLMIRDSNRDSSQSPSNSGCIEISLKRENYKKEYQSVDIRLTILNSFKICSISASKEIQFTPDYNDDVVLSVEKKSLFEDYYGLKKICFIPKDILTVKCEMTICDIIEQYYPFESQLEDTSKYALIEFFESFWPILGMLVCLFILLIAVFAKFLF